MAIVLLSPENNLIQDYDQQGDEYGRFWFRFKRHFYPNDYFGWYLLYLGTSPDDLKSTYFRSQSIGGDVFSLGIEKSSLKPNQKYFWKIVTNDSVAPSHAESPIWNFTLTANTQYNTSGEYLYINGLSNSQRGLKTKEYVIDEEDIEQVQSWFIKGGTEGYYDCDPSLAIFNENFLAYLGVDDEYKSRYGQAIKYNGSDLFKNSKDIQHSSRNVWQKFRLQKRKKKYFIFDFLDENDSSITTYQVELPNEIENTSKVKLKVANHNRVYDGYWDFVYVRKILDNELTIEEVSDTEIKSKIEKYALFINNPNDYDLTDYQVRIDLLSLSCDLKEQLLPSYNNIRFTDENKNPIPHWIEHDINGKNLPIVWVKVPYLKQNSQTKIYVETTGFEINNGDGNQVFELFDDFETLDTNKWVVNRYSGDVNNEQKVENGILWLVKKSRLKGQNILQKTFRISNKDNYKIGLNAFVDYVCGTKNDGDGFQVVINGNDYRQYYGCRKGFANANGVVVNVFTDGYPPSTSQGNGVQIATSSKSCTIDNQINDIKQMYRLPSKTTDLSLFKLEIKLSQDKIKVDYENRYPTPTTTEFSIESDNWDVVDGKEYFMIGQGTGNSNCSNSTNDSAHGIDYVYVQKNQDLEPEVVFCTRGDKYSKKYTVENRLVKSSELNIDLSYELKPFSEIIMEELKNYKGLYIFNNGDFTKSTLFKFDLSKISEEKYQLMKLDGTWIKNKFKLIKPTDECVWYQKLEDGRMLYCKFNYETGATELKYELGFVDIVNDDIVSSYNIVNEFGSDFLNDSDEDGIINSITLNYKSENISINPSLIEKGQQFNIVNNSPDQSEFINILSDFIQVSPNTTYFMRFNSSEMEGQEMVISFYNSKMEYLNSSAYDITNGTNLIKFSTIDNCQFIKIQFNMIINPQENKTITFTEMLLVNLDRLGKLPNKLKIETGFDNFKDINVNKLNEYIPYVKDSSIVEIVDTGFVPRDKIQGTVKTGEYIIPIELDFRIHRREQYIYLKVLNKDAQNLKVNSETDEEQFIFNEMAIILGNDFRKTEMSQLFLEKTQFIPIYLFKNTYQYEYKLLDQMITYDQRNLLVEYFDDIIDSYIPQKLKTSQDLTAYTKEDGQNLQNLFVKNQLINYSWRIPVLDKVSGYRYTPESSITTTQESIMQKKIQVGMSKVDDLKDEKIEEFIWRQLTPFFIRKIQYGNDYQYWTYNVRVNKELVKRIYDLTDRFGDQFHPYDNDLYVKRTFYHYLNDIGVFSDYINDIELNTKIYIFLSLEFYKYIYSYFVQRGKTNIIEKILDHQFKNIGQIVQMFVVKYYRLDKVKIKSYQSTVEQNKFFNYFNTTGKKEIFEKQKTQKLDKYPHMAKKLKRELYLKLKLKGQSITEENIEIEMNKKIENQIYRDLIIVFNKNNLKVQNLKGQIVKFFNFISDHFLPQNMDILFVEADYDTTFVEEGNAYDFVHIIHEPQEEEFLIDVEGSDFEWI